MTAGIDQTAAKLARLQKSRPGEGTVPAWCAPALLAASGMVVLGLLVHNDLKVDIHNAGFVALAFTISLLALCRYQARHMITLAQARVRDFSEYCLIFMTVSLLGVISSYPIAAATSGFHDLALAQTDALLKFDWVEWYAFVVRHPLLRQLGMLSYATIYLSPAILLGHMAWHGKRAEAQRFLMTFWIAAIMTLLLFPLFPAKGPLAFLWNGAIPYMPTSSLYQSQLIPELRAHSFTEIDLGSLRGLVCAPSFHTVCGVLYIAAAWRIAPLRWPLIAMNGAMLLSTPVEGNHYLTDMLFGLLVALTAIALMRTVTQVSERARQSFVGTPIEAT
jgi:hypothetical protein